MPKLTDEQRSAREAQIVRATWSCVQEKGVDATSMKDIAAAAGLSVGGVYSYFPSKEELITVLIQSSMFTLRALAILVLERKPVLSPPDNLRAIVHEVVTYSASPRAFDLVKMIMIGIAEGTRNDKVRLWLAEFYKELEVALVLHVERWRRSQGSENGPLQQIAKALVSEFLGCIASLALRPDLLAPTVEQHLEALVPSRAA